MASPGVSPHHRSRAIWFVVLSIDLDPREMSTLGTLLISERHTMIDMDVYLWFV